MPSSCARSLFWLSFRIERAIAVNRYIEQKTNKSYRQFYRQWWLLTLTISDLQRREAPLSSCNHC